VPVLLDAAHQRYGAAARLLGVETELWRRVKDADTFDHRVLQVAHDKIAAYYRFTHDDGGQLSFTDAQEGTSYKDRLARDWPRFFHAEVERLATRDAITTAILTAVAYQNAEPGHAAEEHLSTLLDGQYGDLGEAATERTRRKTDVDNAQEPGNA
jgi:hypothetical protein